MFLSRPKSSTGMTMAAMMMTPPMEGTPILLTPKGSMEASRCFSVICFLRRYLMNRSPNQAEMTSEKMRASKALKEI